MAELPGVCNEIHALRYPRPTQLAAPPFAALTMLTALILPHAYQLPALRSPVARASALTNVQLRADAPTMAAGFFGLGGGGGGLPSEVTEVVNGFATEKDPAAIRALWTELKRAYGDEATAVQAVLRQPQIINPSYTDPPAVISRSKAVLVEYMGEEESIEVMLKNPSVLQCGERGLREVGPDEIKGFAQIASLGHKLGPQLQVALFGLGIGCVIFQILYNGATPEVQALMEPGRNIIAPLIGIFFGITVEGSRLTIVGAIFKNKVIEGKEFGVDKYGKSAAEVRAAKAR